MSQNEHTPLQEPVLSVKGLSIAFNAKKRQLNAVEDLSFSVQPGEILGVVGESGCGKSITSLAIMGLLPSNAQVTAGSIKLMGRELVGMPEKELYSVRGGVMSMIFQDPMTALNPTMTIGAQLAETFMVHEGLAKREARTKAAEMLELVGVPAPQKRMGEYPHQLSGGLLQRIVIAIALSCNPKLLIADEPTTALDVTIQAQILDLIKDVCRKTGTAVVLITHDMGVVAQMADRVLVLYAGKSVECAGVHDLFASPKHPYTQALLSSIPSLDTSVEWLDTIPGTVPTLDAMPVGCRFAPRCSKAAERCACEMPQLEGSEHLVRCFEAGEEEE